MLAKTAPLIHQVPTTGGVLKRIKYFARGIAFAPYTKEWFQILQAPMLAIAIQNHPCLFHKLQRPYLNRTLNTRRRLETLKQHYGFVATHLPMSLIKEIYATSGVLLATIPLEGVGPMGLRLGCSKKEKEGEFSIVLVNEDLGAELFTLSFSVSRCEVDCKEVFIGGLQGSKSVNKDLPISITRGWHGLRPKALLVFALQELAASWEITSLRAVSDGMHIYRHFDKRRTLQASYDKFWIECGGELAGDGMFDLPVSFVPRDISSIRINKRKMYRRRYVMLAEIAAQIRHVMPCPAGPRGPDQWLNTALEPTATAVSVLAVG